MTQAIDWREARKVVYAAGRAVQLPAGAVPLSEADGRVLAEPLRPATALPAFPTSSVDGFALRGPGPWRVVGQVLAGQVAAPLTDDSTAMEIATGAMVPEGAEAILRVEHSSREGDVISGEGAAKEWRDAGEEAEEQEDLYPAGTRVNPGLLGLAAACGLDTLTVYRKPRVALLVFGDELLTEGPPAAGRIRDALGPMVPSYLARLGAECVRMIGPVEDTLEAHLSALREVLDDVDVVCTTGGTMRGPVDHLHPTLEELGATYVVNTVAVRPGFPMLVASIPHDGREVFVAGLPGNPQSAVVAIVSLLAPLLAGLTGAAEPMPSPITLGAPVPGRGDYTHLALVKPMAGAWYPVSHVGSAMLRGLAGAGGFAVIPPHGQGLPGHQADFVELP